MLLLNLSVTWGIALGREEVARYVMSIVDRGYYMWGGGGVQG